MTEKPTAPLREVEVSAIHQIIRKYLPTSSEIADARMYDAARDIAALYQKQHT